MFTGLISDIGRVRARKGEAAGVRFEIATNYSTEDLDIGASIACSGACLTVVGKGAGWFAVEASAETLARTTLESWREGHWVNLERALKLGDELGGHMVSGHVDGVAEITGRRDDGDSIRLTVRPPESLSRFIAAKGSVTLDGVSLTVNEIADDGFGVNIIPHTAAMTTFGELQPRDTVNLEIDMLARYVARLME